MLLFPRVLVQLVVPKRRAGHHVHGCGVIRVRLHALAQRVQLLARHPQLAGEARGGFPFAMPRPRRTSVAGRWRGVSKTVLVGSV
jgi:hypothetical protein